MPSSGKRGDKATSKSSSKPPKTGQDSKLPKHPAPNKGSGHEIPSKTPAGSRSAAAAPDGDASRKTDTRTLIGGHSWTGKLPVNILSEHCQKQGYHKPEYTMTRNSEGFLSTVILKKTDKKTQATTTLPPIRLSKADQAIAFRETAVEARHFAATLALYRLCSGRNLHMMLPPIYRDLWKGELQALKDQDLKAGNDWMYSPDPFQARKELEHAQATRLRKQEEEAKKKSQSPSKQAGLPAKSRRLATVDMGKATRSLVQSVVQRNATWNRYGLTLSEKQRTAIVQNLTQLGFRHSHIQEALEECGDRQECLEWLLTYVPEDDLPSWSLPEDYAAGISVASSDLKRAAAITRLAAGGYSRDLCTQVLSQHGNLEADAAEELQRMLASDLDVSSPNLAEPNDDTRGDWDEELTTLDAIYGDRVKRISASKFQISIEPGEVGMICIHVQRPKSYPTTEPIICLVDQGIPAYAKLSATRQAVSHMRLYLGEPMLSNCLVWMEEALPGILANPGPLRNLSTVSSMPQIAPSNSVHSRGSHKPLDISSRLKNQAAESQRLFQEWARKQEDPAQKAMLAQRMALPAWPLKEEIVQVVKRSQVTIISGETGSGKSTQTVQFILDDMLSCCTGSTVNVMCSQPRRIAAIGLASRVSEERCSRPGNEIGYSVRGESKRTAGRTRIMFVTTGILLRRLQSRGSVEGGEIASTISDLSHIVVDEVHERSVDSDLLLTLLREILKSRPSLKVILMSATMDSDVFSAYFKHSGVSVGAVHIPGRTYPIEDFYLEDIIRKIGFGQSRLSDKFPADSFDHTGALRALGPGINYELIAATVRSVDSELGREGSILIFLPGEPEISRCVDALRRIPSLEPLPLHGSLAPTEQKRVFSRPNSGKRKVVVATNIAETSITIDDVLAVVDTGRVKENSLDPQTNISKLATVWASRAACQQRRGRAGRVQAGTCYKLFTRNAELKMAARPDPEMIRIPLEQLCLSVRAMGFDDVDGFLGKVPTPPKAFAVEGALALLTSMGALHAGHLTALGRHLSTIPADLRCGKLLVYGALFGCFESCLIVASILSARSPFFSPQDRRDEARSARKSFSAGNGDLVADLRAYEEWRKQQQTASRAESRSWCDANFLSSSTLWDIATNRLQYLATLKETGLVPPQYADANTDRAGLNVNDDNMPMLRSLIAGSFNPQIAKISFPETRYMPSVSGAVAQDPEARTLKYFTRDSGRVFTHPGSVLFDAQSFVGESEFLAFFSRMATSKVFIRDLTPFNAYGMLMFCGPIDVDAAGKGLRVDGWVYLKGWAKIGVLASRLRGVLDLLLERKMEDPSLALSTHEVIQAVTKLVEFNGLDR